MHRGALLVSLIVILVGAAGCETPAALRRDSAAPPDPGGQPCRQVYSERRCLAMADDATAFSEKTRDDVASIVILPDPTPEIGPDGGVILQTRSGAAPILIRVRLRDGTTLDTQVCGGVSGGPACFDDPPAWATEGSLIGAGYHDIPCPEDPSGCPSPIPSIDPSTASGATPIVVTDRTVVVDHVGAYEVSLGTGSLSNGVLTEGTYRLPDPWPVDVTFTADSTPRLVLRSLEPDGKPFDNVYAHGWRDGLERIEAVLVFDVKRFDPGATLEVRDVVVR